MCNALHVVSRLVVVDMQCRCLTSVTFAVAEPVSEVFSFFLLVQCPQDGDAADAADKESEAENRAEL
jgi:hypothetical protein